MSITVGQLRKSVGVHCVPSADSIDELREADVVLLSGQFVGAGKSTFIQTLEQQGRANIPSWTNRELRTGEQEGVDKCHRAISVMATKVVEGYFLELEEVRPEIFYATPAEFSPGQKYVKDLELKGAMRLRSFEPTLPIVVPLPPIRPSEHKQVTEWERRVVKREAYHERVDDQAVADLQGRLLGVVEEATRLEELHMANDPYTLLIVNDDLPSALEAVTTFLWTGEKPSQTDLSSHIKSIKDIATVALDTSLPV